MSNPTRTYLLIEERLGEPLADYVTTRRDPGDKSSWLTIARNLSDRTDVFVTPETLRLWFAESVEPRAKATA